MSRIYIIAVSMDFVTNAARWIIKAGDSDTDTHSVTSSVLGGMSVKASWAPFTANEYLKKIYQSIRSIEKWKAIARARRLPSVNQSFIPCVWMWLMSCRLMLAGVLRFFSWYSMAALRLKASTRAVWCSTSVLPTLRTSMPSVVRPTLSSAARWRWMDKKGDHLDTK